MELSDILQRTILSYIYVQGRTPRKLACAEPALLQEFGHRQKPSSNIVQALRSAEHFIYIEIITFLALHMLGHHTKMQTSISRCFFSMSVRFSFCCEKRQGPIIWSIWSWH